MIGVIITGHGNFATGLESSLNLIAGPSQDCVLVDFIETDGVNELRTKLEAAVTKLSHCDGILVFSDLAGGSPFKVVAELKLEKNLKMEIVAGTNLGMLIETLMSRAFVEDLNDLTNLALNTGKSQVVKFELVAHHEESMEDGI